MPARHFAVPLVAVALLGSGCSQEPTRVEQEGAETRALIEAMSNHPTLEQAKRQGPEQVTIHAPAGSLDAHHHGPPSVDDAASPAKQAKAGEAHAGH